MVTDVTELFHDIFEMVPATTVSLKESVYRLRHQVYCLETGFEDPKRFPDGLEKDEYDEYSEHFLIRHRQTNECVATTRLILPDPNNPARLFPIERHAQLECANLLKNIPRRQVAEVSRFCVSEHFKRREGESHTLAGVGPYTPLHQPSCDGNKRVFANYLTLALITCGVRMSIQHGIVFLYAFMELPFARLLRNLGLSFVPIGPLVEYHGRRRPYLIKIADLLAGAKLNNIEVWKMATNHGEFWEESDRDMVESLCADDEDLKPRFLVKP